MKTAILGWDHNRGVVLVELHGQDIHSDLVIVRKFMTDKPWLQSSAIDPEGPENVLNFCAHLLRRLGFELKAGGGVRIDDAGRWLH